MNTIIDSKIPGQPQFERKEVHVYGQIYDLWHRDLNQCIQALYGKPEFTKYLITKPERHWVDQAHTTRLYHDMHTAEWWWNFQVKYILIIYIYNITNI